MNPQSGESHHILLPQEGFRFKQPPTEDDLSAVVVSSLPTVPGLPKLLDRSSESGPLLVEAHPEAAAALSRHKAFRVAPVVFYRPAWVDRTPIAVRTSSAGSITVRVVSAADGQPVVGAGVAGVVDLNTGRGVAGVTDGEGRCTLASVRPGQSFAAFYVTPKFGFWSWLGQDFAPNDATLIKLTPIDLRWQDAVRYFYGSTDLDAGRGVKVGIVDTGAGPHPDLLLAGGRNTVVGEDPGDYSDNGLGHGSHVAGIVGARGTPPSGVRGLAPGCDLYSYRVYGQNQGECSNFAVIKAIDQAIADGCHLLNLSLALSTATDPGVSEALKEARAAGMLPIASAGNSGFGPRSPVDYPATDVSAVAISAMGRQGTFPDGTLEVAEAAAPFGTDPANFLARFSSAGAQVAFTGPGVGIISTFQGNLYAVMDGTSMASPAVCGRAAAVLANNPNILGMERSADRAEAILQLMISRSTPIGLGSGYEGHGLLTP